MADYAEACFQNPDDCDFSRKFGFTSIDLTGGLGNDGSGFLETGPANEFYCCQPDRNCDDGYEGCFPVTIIVGTAISHSAQRPLTH